MRDARRAPRSSDRASFCAPHQIAAALDARLVRMTRATRTPSASLTLSVRPCYRRRARRASTAGCTRRSRQSFARGAAPSPCGASSEPTRCHAAAAQPVPCSRCAAVARQAARLPQLTRPLGARAGKGRGGAWRTRRRAAEGGGVGGGRPVDQSARCRGADAPGPGAHAPSKLAPISRRSRASHAEYAFTCAGVGAHGARGTAEGQRTGQADRDLRRESAARKGAGAAHERAHGAAEEGA